MPDYAKGKVYLLKNTTTGHVYVGSTCSSLNKRYNHHKSTSRYTTHCTSNFLFEADGDVTIELLEDYPCDSAAVLRSREAFHLSSVREHHGDLCVNRCTPNRSLKEYLQQYYVANKQTISCKAKESYVLNKDDILSSQRERYHDDIDASRERKRETYHNQPVIKCPCGSTYNRHNQSAHVKTKRHMEFMNQGLEVILTPS